MTYLMGRLSAYTSFFCTFSHTTLPQGNMQSLEE